MTWLAWAAFAAVVAIIGAAGYRMCKAADDIAEISGLSRAWVGLLLLSIATSLPELVTGLSAIALFDAPNVAVGDALGSCVFNLLILVVLELLARGESLYARVGSGHTVSAAFGVVLAGFIAFSILVAPASPALRIGHVGLYTPVILGAYLVALYTVFQHERRMIAAVGHQPLIPGVDVRSLRTAVRRYAVSAAFVIAAGAVLPRIAVEIARQMGWSNTFVGTIFVAFATSVPEVAVSITAVAIGSVDMAVANLLGSNLFDVAIVALDDLVYTAGPILSAVSPSHAVTAVSAAVMSGVAIVGFSYRPAGRLFRVSSWVGLTLFAIYLFNAFVQYLHGE
ncbi:MAG TPA: sodium:calcium antiporter [Gammaproteobacteria bacterium]|nr:sodium:calcium antiporter [Gammaproteobacteria bacterium]